MTNLPDYSAIQTISSGNVIYLPLRETRSDVLSMLVDKLKAAHKRGWEAVDAKEPERIAALRLMFVGLASLFLVVLTSVTLWSIWSAMFLGLGLAAVGLAHGAAHIYVPYRNYRLALQESFYVLKRVEDTIAKMEEGRSQERVS